MTPAISVVIPTFNRRAMVGDAVQSVFRQKAAPDFELLIVDDGSTDGSAEELGQLTRTLPRPAALTDLRIIRTENRGVAAARNRGAAAARAPLLAFLDSDDLWQPQKLARQFARMSQNPSCRLLQTGEIWMRAGRRVNPARRHLKAAGDIFIPSLRTCLISPSAVMIAATLLREVGGFDELMTACEDYDLWLRVLVDHEAGLLDEPLVIRRDGHPGQLSATIPALDRFRICSLAAILARDDLSAERRNAAAEVLAEKCAIYASGLCRRDRARAAQFYSRVEAAARGSWRLKRDPALAQALATMRAALGPPEPDQALGQEDPR